MSMSQYNPPHPGELIYRTYMEPFDGISASKIAMKMGVNKSTFS